MTSRGFASALWLLTALVLQLTLVGQLDLPLGHPNLALTSVICLALLNGPGPGMGYGFVAGLLGDALSTHTLGRLALVWTLLGYGCGLASPGPRGRRNPLLAVLVVVVGSVLAGAAFVVTGLVLGDALAPTRQLAKIVAAAGLYDLLLALLVYPALRLLFNGLDAVAA